MSEQITSLLHHRAPYLFPEKIVEDSKNTITTFISCDPSWPVFQGHFPGAPVLPGTMMLEFCVQSAGALIAKHHNPDPDFDTNRIDGSGWALGVLSRVKRCKYKSFLRPGDEVFVKVELEEAMDQQFHFKARVEQEGSLIMYSEFVLANIEAKKLLKN